jgi:two-component system, OmpR family, response regulator BaeR
MQSERILVVEDEQKIADLLQDYLSAEGFQVACLLRGDEALEQTRRLAPDLILLDLMLPGLDGIAVCREIRKFSNVPIIMVTAKVEEVDRLIGLEIGADDYICKPFSPREVVARVKAVLRRTHPSDSPRRLVVGPLLLDEDSREVTVDGKPTNLTPSEFGLLSVLMSSPERVFSRSELVDKIQGYRFEGYDRTIDSHVKNLRKKIAARLPGKEIIQTIYGVGYRLSV